VKENWKDVPGYEGYYQVSDLGRVRSLDRCVGNRTYEGKNLTPVNTSKGYFRIKLGRKGSSFLIHRLVMLAFKPINHYKEVNHINGIKKRQ